MKNLIIIIVSAVVLAGCAARGDVVVLNDEKITSAKLIGLDAPSAPWVAQIERRLKTRGFTVKRISRDETRALTATWADYILVLDGAYETGWGRRCLGGGLIFEYLNADLVNLKTNESVLSVYGQGYSENCGPLSGTIYGDIVKAVSDKWAE